MVSENSDNTFSVQMERTRASYTFPTSKLAISKLFSQINSVLQLFMSRLLYWTSNKVSSASFQEIVAFLLDELCKSIWDGVSMEQFETCAPVTIKEKSWRPFFNPPLCKTVMV